MVEGVRVPREESLGWLVMNEDRNGESGNKIAMFDRNPSLFYPRGGTDAYCPVAGQMRAVIGTIVGSRALSHG
jgi:hypothetical protein